MHYTHPWQLKSRPGWGTVSWSSCGTKKKINEIKLKCKMLMQKAAKFFWKRGKNEVFLPQQKVALCGNVSGRCCQAEPKICFVRNGKLLAEHYYPLQCVNSSHKCNAKFELLFNSQLILTQRGFHYIYGILSSRTWLYKKMRCVGMDGIHARFCILF